MNNQTTEQSAACAPDAEPPGKKLRFGMLTIVAIGGLASVLVMAFPQNNSRPAHLAAWIVGAFYVAVADAIVWSAVLRRWKDMQRVRVLCAVVVGGFVGSHFMLTKDVAFNRAFGIDTPEFAGEVGVEGHYSRGIPGGMSDLTIFLQFNVDRAGLQQILSERGFERDRDTEQLWSDFDDPWSSDGRRSESREAAWKSLFGGFQDFSSAKWRDVPLPPTVEVYRAGEPAMHHARLLWDVDTGRTYALYTLG